jgi:hypothetical protein
MKFYFPLLNNTAWHNLPWEPTHLEIEITPEVVGYVKNLRRAHKVGVAASGIDLMVSAWPSFATAMVELDGLNDDIVRDIDPDFVIAPEKPEYAITSDVVRLSVDGDSLWISTPTQLPDYGDENAREIETVAISWYEWSDKVAAHVHAGANQAV